MAIPGEAPLSASKEFETQWDDMTEMVIRIYQSDHEAQFVADEGIVRIGEFFLTGIPAKPKGQERVTVTFEIDQQNLLKVAASSSTSVGGLEINRS